MVEIGEAEGAMGGVYKVKPLGVLAMIDDGELDWKIICININDPKAALVNDVEDVERCALGWARFSWLASPAVLMDRGMWIRGSTKWVINS